MKVIIVTCSVSRLAGGLLDAVRDLYLNLENPNIEIIVFSYYDKFTSLDIDAWGNLDIRLYKKSNPFFYSQKLKDDILTSKADILHIHGLWRYPHALVTSWKHATGNPVIVSPHGMLDPYILRNRSYFKRVISNCLFPKKSFKNIDYYHALCQGELRDIRAFGITKPVAIIPNGIDIKPIIDKVSIQNIKKHLLFLGRLHPKKGIDLLLHAYGDLYLKEPKRLNNWSIDIVGWPQENYERKLKLIVKKYGIEELVKFHGGLFGHSKIKMFNESDAFILPSYGEGLPMAILEAWSWGLPVLMTPQCNLSEGFASNAAICLNNSIPSIKEKLKELFSMDSESLAEMGMNGKILVDKMFSWSLSAKKLDQIYNWILKSEKIPEFLDTIHTDKAT